MDENKNWFGYEKNRLSVLKLQEPFSNIFVGEMPTYSEFTHESASFFDHYVNVSMTPFELNGYDKEINANFHWFPLDEGSFFGFQSLFWFKHKMDGFYNNKENVYVHCEAGINRSPKMTLCWLLSLGINVEEGSKIIYGENNPDMLIEGFEDSIQEGYLPSVTDLMHFYNNYFKDETTINTIHDDAKLAKYLRE
jgi:hypothetical protein